MRKDVVALAVGDLHLCHTKPAIRDCDDWYGVMAYYLEQLTDCAEKYDVPILCAGDVFDHWNSSPELINFAIDYLPEMYAVPGQHDLPYHGMDRITKSAFWTLVRAGKIRPIAGLEQVNDELNVNGFPWGVEVRSRERTGEPVIALVHAYIWQKGAGFSTAPDSQHTSGWKERLQGYDLAIFGDNHQGFTAAVGGCLVYNCGAFIRRSKTELKTKPAIGLVHGDGSVTRKHMTIKVDRFFEDEVPDKDKEDEIEAMAEFVSSLNSLELASIDFCSQLRRVLEEEDVREPVKQLVRQILDDIRQK